MKEKRVQRKLWALLLSAALLCGTVSVQAAEAEAFLDVPKGAWYHDHVYDLVGKGVVNGTSATTFSPGSSLTRGAFAAMLANTVLTKEELGQYAYQGGFKDLTPKHWANCYINWATENGIVSGYKDKTCRPDKPVTREEMAVMAVRFANATGRHMSAINPAFTFGDSGSISRFAISGVAACQQAGVISGYQDGTFRPKGLATRAEAAAMYANFLKKCLPGKYRIIRKRVYGTPVKAVEFDPADYTANLVMGRDLVDGGESSASIVDRTGAVIAANAAFFDMSSYLPLGTLIKEGRVVTVFDKYAPQKSSLTMDSSGKFSIQNFSTSFSVSLHREDGSENVLNHVGFNTWPNNKADATRILFTRDWGHTLCFSASDAVTLDENGVILSVDHDKDVSIPEKGYVLAQRSRREYEGDFFDSCQVGGTLEIRQLIEGADSQDIQLSIGAGPRIVKDGAVYGSLDSYRAEGFTDPNITTYSALRMCAGIKPDGKLLLLSAETSLAQLAKIMVGLGCQDVINFDGGGSANLYVSGSWVVGPQSRLLNNMLIFT